MSRELERQLAGLHQGEHLCLIYENTSEQMAAVVPFLREGLARGELTLYVADREAIADASAALASAGVDVHHEVERGALLLLTERESYLLSGVFDPEALFQALGKVVEDALKAGFTGLRSAADMSWVLGSDAYLDLLPRSEAMTNQFLPGKPITFLCQYHRRRFTPATLRQILRSHPVAILGEMVCPNPFYEPPEMILGQGNEAAHVEWMFAQLHRARAAELSLEEMNAQLEARVAERTLALAQELERRRRAEEERAQLLVREQAARVEAQRQAAEMNAILQGLAEAVIVADPSGRIVLRNRAASEITGVTAEEAQERLATGREPPRMSDGTIVPFGQWPIQRALRGEQSSGEEFLLQRPDGTTARVIVGISSVRDERGDIQLGIATFRDVTELRRLEQMREEYVSLISHDLRNPLTALMGHSQFLQRHLEQKGLEQESHTAELVVKNARRMNAMIHDLVESVRLESGYLDLHKEATDLARLVQDVAEQVSVVELRSRITIRSAEGLPLVPADPDRIERAITNLLSNALKYSPPESPVVVQIERRGEEVLISVTDQGEGIPAHELPHLFQRFYRIKSGKSTEGLGLGLYISRMIADAHGGRIWVESEPGGGSSFYLALPIDTAPPIP